MKRLGEVVLEMERQRATAIRPMEVVRVLKELKMPKPALAKPPAEERKEIDTAEAFERRVAAENNSIGSLCLTVERELFGQAPLNEIHGPTVGKELEQQLRRIEEHLLLLERCHRMMTRSFTHLEARRSKSAPSASVVVGQAGQVNVDCAVINEVGS